MRQAEIINIRGVEIVYLDFSNLKTKEDILGQLEVFGSYIRKNKFKSQRTLTNLEGMYFNTEIYNAFVKYVNLNNPYVISSAVIGLKGLIQIFYRGFLKVTGRNVVVCQSKEEALTKLCEPTLVVV